jgi:cyclophilin family peptidyl-prolyl cis-trans isomerase
MILASTMSTARRAATARRLAAFGLVAMLFSGCSVPTVTPSPTPVPPPTLAPTTPAYTLGPAVAADACPTSAPPAFTGTATVTMSTNFGNIVIKVDGSLGPNAAGSFLALARCGYYNNVLFHRVVPSFVIQAGDGTYGRMPNPKLGSKLGSGGPSWTITDDPVKSTYKRGTMAIARTGAPNSGNSQFFIVLSDSAAASLAGAGANNYAIFGDVTSGMDVVDKIANVPTGGDDSPPSMPLQPVVITGTTVATP